MVFCPYWPVSLGALSFPVIYRGHRLTVRVSGNGIEISSDPGASGRSTSPAGTRPHAWRPATRSG
ncbi:hypothetical protein K8O92_25920 [Nocardia asteroides]|nr:hypothetical protein [Streptomyces gardneri]UAK31240.1 hypothetical protein K8O92_25920 [Nocardia asteroides]